MINSLRAKEAGEGLVRAADLGQNLALNGRAREAPELADELAHGAEPPGVAIPGHVRGHVTLQAALAVPVRRGRIARAPFLPLGIGRLHVDEVAPEPDP